MSNQDMQALDPIRHSTGADAPDLVDVVNFVALPQVLLMSVGVLDLRVGVG
jgi:hypothetical protein